MKTIGIWMVVGLVLVGALFIPVPACAWYRCTYQTYTIQVPDYDAGYPGATRMAFVYCTKCCQSVGNQIFCNTVCN